MSNPTNNPQDQQPQQPQDVQQKFAYGSYSNQVTQEQLAEHMKND